MKIRITLFSCLIAMLFLAIQPFSFAQNVTTASISGTVTDQSGNPLPGATVIAVHVPSGTQYGTTSRPDGKYNFSAVRVGGPYQVTVSFVGYQKQTHDIDKLVLGQNYSLDVQLSETSIEISGVTVSANRTAIINNNRTGSSQNVSARQMEELPTIRQNFCELCKNVSNVFRSELPGSWQKQPL